MGLGALPAPVGEQVDEEDGDGWAIQRIRVFIAQLGSALVWCCSPMG